MIDIFYWGCLAPGVGPWDKGKVWGVTLRSSLLLNQNQNQKLIFGNKTLQNFESANPSEIEIATESTFTFELAEKATEKAKLQINLPPEFDVNSIASKK